MLSESDIRATIEMLENAVDNRLDSDFDPALTWSLTAEVLRWVLDDGSKAAAGVEHRMEDAREALDIHPEGL